MPDPTPPKKGGLWARLFAMASENACDDKKKTPSQPPEAAAAKESGASSQESGTRSEVPGVTPDSRLPAPEAESLSIAEALPAGEALPVGVPVDMPVAAPEPVPLAQPVSAALLETPFADVPHADVQVADVHIEAVPEFPVDLEIDSPASLTGAEEQTAVLEADSAFPLEALPVSEDLVPRFLHASLRRDPQTGPGVLRRLRFYVPQEWRAGAHCSWPGPRGFGFYPATFPSFTHGERSYQGPFHEIGELLSENEGILPLSRPGPRQRQTGAGRYPLGRPKNRRRSRF